MGLEARLHAFKIRTYFECVISSSDAGFKKPQREIFEYALKISGCDPQDAVYVGDRYDNDSLLSKQLGFTTVHFLNGLGKHQPITKMQSDDTIESLTQLLDLF